MPKDNQGNYFFITQNPITYKNNCSEEIKMSKELWSRPKTYLRY
jgi:hypothetical protein